MYLLTRDLIIVLIFSLVGTLLLAPIFIPLLSKLKFGQYVRDDGPDRHFKKAGTPTMGGIIFLIPLFIAAVYFGRASTEFLTAAVITLCYGTIGFVDDFLKVVLKRSLGLKAKYKLGGQIILGIFLAFYAVFYLDRGTDVIIPLTNLHLDLGYLYFLFVVLVLVGSTNAVNLTDGLDGLAAGTTLFVAVGYVFISIMTGKPELAVFAAVLAGGCIGFLVFNFYPAKIFMGDTGSLALGAAVAVLAVLTSTELILPLIGGVYVIETLSVIIQVISFKLTGKRIFLMSPLHHHFELSGWPEERIVISFWIMGAVFTIIGVFSLINLV